MIVRHFIHRLMIIRNFIHGLKLAGRVHVCVALMVGIYVAPLILIICVEYVVFLFFLLVHLLDNALLPGFFPSPRPVRAEPALQHLEVRLSCIDWSYHRGIGPYGYVTLRFYHPQVHRSRRPYSSWARVRPADLHSLRAPHNFIVLQTLRRPRPRQTLQHSHFGQTLKLPAYLHIIRGRTRPSHAQKSLKFLHNLPLLQHFFLVALPRLLAWGFWLRFLKPFALLLLFSYILQVVVGGVARFHSELVLVYGVGGVVLGAGLRNPKTAGLNANLFVRGLLVHFVCVRWGLQLVVEPELVVRAQQVRGEDIADNLN